MSGPDAPTGRDRPFVSLDEVELNHAATAHGFKRKRERNWIRHTEDFVQLVNLQRSQWSPDDHYLNFALWPLAFGEPPSIAESKFHFRTRGDRLGSDLDSVFAAADQLLTLDQLGEAHTSKRVSGLMTKQLQALIAER